MVTNRTTEKATKMSAQASTDAARLMVEARSGVPAGTPTSAAEWKTRTSQGTLLVVPSGNTCRVRIKGMDAFLREGVVPNGLMSIIQNAMATPGTQDIDTSSLATPEKLAEIIELADAVCVDTLIEPRVYAIPAEGEGRDPDHLYVDEVDFNDKMYIFNFVVGGTADLEKFRQ